jgi:hypothetical protein
MWITRWRKAVGGSPEADFLFAQGINTSFLGYYFVFLAYVAAKLSRLFCANARTRPGLILVFLKLYNSR